MPSAISFPALEGRGLPRDWIKPDLLLNYRKVDGAILRLARLGSHSSYLVESFL